ncbi:hypothetical protein A3A60_01330 [Candidatus Curtissbacteria bacterium RIFCSPLOWO2_01_FULL_42_26]|uniref:Glycosyltransferase RgtA/B/C/D-like domain-containing protein n=1 Tax=Candidatus Curtissbacteria bacterium RIFCSPLOWO2_01_FULL_42_26 TaxID=1797729 RepID=A0A1F5HYH6_9BACT|nr:MAG: hypothetical protein A3A60_01330 [Candidatus Curtissbacteria bacterium RIFCSPLOWO2_01_FULL_42_26]
MSLMLQKINYLAVFTFLALAVYWTVTVTTSADTYWHMSIGRNVWQQKAIPANDPFTYGSPKTNYTSVEWLSGTIMYGAVSLMGVKGLILIRLIAGLTSLYLFYLTLKLITEDDLVRLSFVAVAGFLLALRLSDRPETASFIAITLVNYVCILYYFKSKTSWLVYLLPPVFLLWPHLHAFSPMAMAIFSFWIFFFLITKRRIRAPFLIIYCISLLLSLLQLKRFLYPFIVLKPAFYKILEMSSLPERLTANKGFDFFNQIPVEIYFYLAILAFYIAAVIFAVKKTQVKNISTIAPPVIYLLLFTVAFKFYRLIPILTLTCLPGLLLALKYVFTLKQDTHTVVKKIFYFSILIIIITSVMTRNIFRGKVDAFVITGPNNEIVDVVNENWKQAFPKNLPTIIQNNLASQRIFTNGNWNNYVIWYLPQTKVFSDAMFEYRTQQDYQNEQTIAASTNGWEKLLNDYKIDTVINPQDLPFLYAKTQVYSSPDWKLIYVDEVATLYAREDIVESLPLDLSLIQPELSTDLKFKPENETQAVDQLEKLMRFDPQNAFARNQLIYYYTQKDLNLAKNLAEESKKLIPKDPTFSAQLAAIYTKQNNCQSANNFAKEAVAKSFNHILIKDNLNRSLQNCNLYYK